MPLRAQNYNLLLWSQQHATCSYRQTRLHRAVSGVLIAAAARRGYRPPNILGVRRTLLRQAVAGAHLRAPPLGCPRVRRRLAAVRRRASCCCLRRPRRVASGGLGPPAPTPCTRVPYALFTVDVLRESVALPGDDLPVHESRTFNTSVGDWHTHPKLFDYVSVGMLAPWKRHEAILDKPGCAFLSPAPRSVSFPVPILLRRACACARRGPLARVISPHTHACPGDSPPPPQHTHEQAPPGGGLRMAGRGVELHRVAPLLGGGRRLAARAPVAHVRGLL